MTLNSSYRALIGRVANAWRWRLWPSYLNRPNSRLRSAAVAQVAGLRKRRAAAGGRLGEVANGSFGVFQVAEPGLG